MKRFLLIKRFWQLESCCQKMLFHHLLVSVLYKAAAFYLMERFKTLFLIHIWIIQQCIHSFCKKKRNPSYLSLADSSVLTLIVARCSGTIWTCQPGRTQLACLWPLFQRRIMCFVPSFVTQSPGGQISSGMLATFDLIWDVVEELITSHGTDVSFSFVCMSLLS